MKKKHIRPAEPDLAAEARQLERDAAQLPKIILLVFGPLAILLIAIAAGSAVFTARALARERSVPARVVELATRPDANGRVYAYPVVEFYLPDETRQTLRIPEGSSPPAYALDQRVVIRYDPARPAQTVRIQPFGSDLLPWFVSLVTGGLGLVFLLAASLVARFFGSR